MDTTQNIYFGLDSGGGKTRLTDPTEDLTALLVGKSVSSVDTAAGTLTLSDGAVLTIVPNFGEGWDGEGDFFLDRISTVENAIVAVEAATDHDGALPQGRTETYRINVYTAGIPALQELVSVSGDSGNGYYGSGFTVLVSR